MSKRVRDEEEEEGKEDQDAMPEPLAKRPNLALALVPTSEATSSSDSTTAGVKEQTVEPYEVPGSLPAELWIGEILPALLRQGYVCGTPVMLRRTCRFLAYALEDVARRATHGQGAWVTLLAEYMQEMTRIVEDKALLAWDVVLCTPRLPMNPQVQSPWFRDQPAMPALVASVLSANRLDLLIAVFQHGWITVPITSSFGALHTTAWDADAPECAEWLRLQQLETCSWLPSMRETPEPYRFYLNAFASGKPLTCAYELPRLSVHALPRVVEELVGYCYFAEEPPLIEYHRRNALRALLDKAAAEQWVRLHYVSKVQVARLQARLDMAPRPEVVLLALALDMDKT